VQHDLHRSFFGAKVGQSCQTPSTTFPRKVAPGENIQAAFLNSKELGIPEYFL